MIPVVESSIIRHNVPTATGAMIIGIKKIDVASLAQRRSEQSAIAMIHLTTFPASRHKSRKQ